VARIDAHLLNRQGLTRLCYCGPVLHTRPATAHASREPLQFGAEIYGHAGLEADFEVMELALASLAIGGVKDTLIDLSDVRIAAALMSAHSLDAALQASVYQALAAKDASAIKEMAELDAELCAALLALLGLYGDLSVLNKARQTLPALPAVTAALDGLDWIAKQLAASGLDTNAIRFDLADVGGYGYYTGVRFAIYSEAANDALARGGRYDEVGAVFGRKRPAVGFSLDIKALVDSVRAPAPKASIRMPWAVDPALRLAASALRRMGETVICVLPGHESEADEFACDRELVRVGDQWVVKSL
jgi:ATP phosphoribosyltransferase regulatory subunit